MWKRVLHILMVLLVCTEAGAQWHKGITWSVEGNALWSDGDGYAPFWLTANRHGLSSVETTSGYLRAGLFRSTEQDSLRRWRHGYGLDLAVADGYTSSLIVQQAYYDIDWRWLRLSIGSKERPSELKDPWLSSGGLTFGTNARPIPQVRIEVPHYVTIPGLKELLHVKGYLGYGIYTDNGWQADFALEGSRYTKNALHHVKAGFIKVGNETRFPLYLEAGVEMATQFGGTAYNVTYGRKEMTKGNFRMGSGVKDFLKALVPFGNGGDPTDGEGYANVEGNHLGSWHASLAWQAKTWKVRFYYEHFFEDHSMIIDEYGWEDYTANFGDNGIGSYIPPVIPSGYYWKDGLYGVEVELPANPFVSRVVYEYLNTTEQSGPLYHDKTAQISDHLGGMDNYYNHAIYAGWQHWGMSVGSPFLLSPIYNADRLIQFENNRVRTHHVGVCGSPLSGLDYRLLLSHSKYWGTYAIPLVDTQEQTSALLELSYAPSRFAGWRAKLSLAWDNGKMLGDTWGGMLTLQKTGVLTK